MPWQWYLSCVPRLRRKNIALNSLEPGEQIPVQIRVETPGINKSTASRYVLLIHAGLREHETSIEEERTKRWAKLQLASLSPSSLCFGMPNLWSQLEEAEYLRTIAARCGAGIVSSDGMPRSPLLLLLRFPPAPFALQNTLQSARRQECEPNRWRGERRPGRTSTTLEFLIAARPIAGAANIVSRDDPRKIYATPGLLL